MTITNQELKLLSTHAYSHLIRCPKCKEMTVVIAESGCMNSADGYTMCFSPCRHCGKKTTCDNNSQILVRPR